MTSKIATKTKWIYLPNYKRVSLFLNIRFLIVLSCFASLSLQADDRCRNLSLHYSKEQVQLWQDITHLSSSEMQGRKGGTQGAYLAREYIVQRFREVGLSPLALLSTQLDQHEINYAWHHYFSSISLSSNNKGVNVVGYLPGKKAADFIVVSAHYDHLGKEGVRVFSGANDNASGVAAMFYLAQKLRELKTQHSFLFLATDYEEAGLKGAAAFVEDAVIPLESIKLNMNLDMIAQPGRDWTLYIAGTLKQPDFKPIVEQVIQHAPICFEMGLDKPSRSYDRKTRVDWRKASDHWEFAQKGVPWLYIGVKDFKYYHTPRDTVDKLSQPFYSGAVDTALATLVAMDEYLSQ